MIKRLALMAMRGAPFARLVSLLERWDDWRPGRLAVLTYHRVDEVGARPHLSPSLLSATPAGFAAQMEYLARHYQVVAVQDVLAALCEEKALPPRALLITFDDAYVDFAEHAWPILRRLGLPVTVFVPTAYPDHPERLFWWDRLYQAVSDPSRSVLDTPEGRIPLRSAGQRRRAFKRLREHVKTLDHDAAMAWIATVCGEPSPPPEPTVLGWDALRHLARQGVTLGAHTQTHPLINRVSLARAQAEALGSLEDLRREIGDVLPIFAYPSGGVDPQVAAQLALAGFALAFTTERGLNDLHTADPLRLRRINVGVQTPLAALRAQLVPATSALAAAVAP